MLSFFFFFIFLFLSSVSARVLTQPHTLPVTHAPKHTQLIHPLSRTCDTHLLPDSRLPPAAGRGWRLFPGGWRGGTGGEGGGGRVVGGDEPGSSALSPAIHIRWVHSHTHTCLIAWPIQGGARRVGGALSGRRTAGL